MIVNGVKNDSFICKCEKCKSEKIDIIIGTLYHGGEYYGTKITIKCIECNNQTSEVH